MESLRAGEADMSSGDPDLDALNDPIMRRFGASLPQVMPWNTKDPIKRFQFERKLQDAKRNQGRVDLMTDLKDHKGRRGFQTAVKRMPNAWMTESPVAFAKLHPTSTEKPWTDVAIVQALNMQGCAFVCELLGVFVDDEFSYVVSSFASGGDLFSWSSDSPLKGHEREAALVPMLVQVVTAVRQLHNFGVAHRDLSPENILIDREGSADGVPQMKLCDFSMATADRFCPASEARGKLPCQGPEMHHAMDGYDSFLSDVFGLGVVVFSCFFRMYPWNATKAGKCRLFDRVAERGVASWFAHQSVPRDKTKKFADLVSPGFREVLTGMLDFNPALRLTLGERCYEGARPSIWDSKWAKPQALKSASRSGELLDDASAASASI